MFRVRFLCLALALCGILSVGAKAAEVDCNATYCFTPQDFSQKEEPLTGICITGLPRGDTGTVLLGSRILQTGDILTAEQVQCMTFSPVETREDTCAEVRFLPIYENRVEKSAVMTISIRGRENKAPAAQDSGMETYKNLPNEGKLEALDPEGEKLTFTLCRSPRRGTVELREDGTFCYTPKKNKVGVDSFTFTAADPAGNVSREATVTVQILKPADRRTYTDTVGNPCRFEAEWMRSSGLFEGEKISGQECFYPGKPVSRGEFLAMAVKLLDIPTQEAVQLPEDTPYWLKPYLAAAIRSGLLEGLPRESGSFDWNRTITGGETAVMLQNALDLTVTQKALESDTPEQVPAWAASSLQVMGEHGLVLEAEKALTRADAAEILYQVRFLALEAPGMAVFRMQK